MYIENRLDKRIWILLQIHSHPLLGLVVTSSGCFWLVTGLERSH